MDDVVQNPLVLEKLRDKRCDLRSRTITLHSTPQANSLRCAVYVEGVKIEAGFVEEKTLYIPFYGMSVGFHPTAPENGESF